MCLASIAAELQSQAEVLHESLSYETKSDNIPSVHLASSVTLFAADHCHPVDALAAISLAQAQREIVARTFDGKAVTPYVT